METNGKHVFYLHESTVKAAKEVVMDRQASGSHRNILDTLLTPWLPQAASRNDGEMVTLEDVGENIDDIKREQVTG